MTDIKLYFHFIIATFQAIRHGCIASVPNARVLARYAGVVCDSSHAKAPTVDMRAFVIILARATILTSTAFTFFVASTASPTSAVSTTTPATANVLQIEGIVRGGIVDSMNSNCCPQPRLHSRHGSLQLGRFRHNACTHHSQTRSALETLQTCHVPALESGAIACTWGHQLAMGLVVTLARFDLELGGT